MGPLAASCRGGLFFGIIFASVLGRILGIDFGARRCGIATTDPLQIAVRSLGWQETSMMPGYLVEYCQQEDVTTIVIGVPGKPSAEFSRKLEEFSRQLAKLLPAIPVVMHNEDFSSRQAAELLRQMGVKKKNRQRKEVLDAASAVVILQDYLSYR